MKTFKEFTATLSESKLIETKLSRVFQHFASSAYPVATITAFRNEYTHDQNLARNKDLARTIRENGYGFVFVDGGWIETTESGEKVPVEEDSILVIGKPNDNNKMFELLLAMTKKYNQDGFLFKPEGGLEISIVDKQGNLNKISNSFKLDKFEYGYTKLRGSGGRTYSFHEERDAPNGVGVRLKREFS